MHFMEEKAEKATEGKKSTGVMGLLGWLGMILVVYVLSAGPVVRMFDKGMIPLNSKEEKFLQRFYRPLDWAYSKTPLHKPLGMYGHLWSDKFDSNGEVSWK